jgi:hypothetical protein
MAMILSLQTFVAIFIALKHPINVQEAIFEAGPDESL